MAQPKPIEEELLARIRNLPPERVAEVEDFVDFPALEQARGAVLDADGVVSARLWRGSPGGRLHRNASNSRRFLA